MLNAGMTPQENMTLPTLSKPMHFIGVIVLFTMVATACSTSNKEQNESNNNLIPAIKPHDQANQVAHASTMGGSIGPIDKNEIDDIMRAYQGKQLPGKKKKDVLPGDIKVNLYQDKGHLQINRAKVDLDRDDKWDQIWSYGDDGSVKVKVSTRDNGQYDQIKTWVDEAWTEKGNKGQSNSAILGNAASEWDSDAIMLRLKGQRIPKSKKKDAYKGPFKVNLYQDKGHTQINRAKIDLDRDGKWDQLWTYMADGSIAVKISYLDNEQYNESKIWIDGAWKP